MTARMMTIITNGGGGSDNNASSSRRRLRRLRPNNKPRGSANLAIFLAPLLVGILSGGGDGGPGITGTGTAAAFRLRISMPSIVTTTTTRIGIGDDNGRAAMSPPLGTRPHSSRRRRSLWAYVDSDPSSTSQSTGGDGKGEAKQRPKTVGDTVEEESSSSSSSPMPSWLDPDRSIGDILPVDEEDVMTSPTTLSAGRQTDEAEPPAAASVGGGGPAEVNKDGGVFVVGPTTTLSSNGPAADKSTATTITTTTSTAADDDDGKKNDDAGVGVSVSGGKMGSKEAEKFPSTITSDIGTAPSRRKSPTEATKKVDAKATESADRRRRGREDDDGKEWRGKATTTEAVVRRRSSSGLEKMGFGSAASASSSAGDGRLKESVKTEEETAVVVSEDEGVDDESAEKSSSVVSSTAAKVAQVGGGGSDDGKVFVVAPAASSSASSSSAPPSMGGAGGGATTVPRASSSDENDVTKRSTEEEARTKESADAAAAVVDDASTTTTTTTTTSTTSATSELLEERDMWMDHGENLPEATVPGSDFHTVDVDGEVEFEYDGLVEPPLSSSSKRKAGGGSGSSATTILSEKDEWIDSIASSDTTATTATSGTVPPPPEAGGARSSSSSSSSSDETTTTLVDPPSISSGIGGGGGAVGSAVGIDGGGTATGANVDGGSTGNVKAAAISSAALHSLAGRTRTTTGGQDQGESQRSPTGKERDEGGEKEAVVPSSSSSSVDGRARRDATAATGRTEDEGGDEKEDSSPHPPSLEEMMFPSLVAAKTSDPSSRTGRKTISDSNTGRGEAKEAPVPQIYDAKNDEWVDKKEDEDQEGLDVDSWLRRSPSTSSAMTKAVEEESTGTGAKGPSIGDMMFPALMGKKRKEKDGAGAAEGDMRAGEGDAVVTDRAEAKAKTKENDASGEMEAAAVMDARATRSVGGGETAAAAPIGGTKKRTVSPANMTAGIRPRASATLSFNDGILSPTTAVKNMDDGGVVDQTEKEKEKVDVSPIETTTSSGTTVRGREEQEKVQKKAEESKKPDKEAVASIPIPLNAADTATETTAESGGTKPIVVGKVVSNDQSRPLTKPAFVVDKSSLPGGASGEISSAGPSPSASALAVGSDSLAFLTPYTTFDELMDLSEGYVLECATGNLLRAAIGSAKTAAYAAESLLDAITRREVVDGAGEAVASLTRIVRGDDDGGVDGQEEDWAADDVSSSPAPATDVLRLSRTALSSAGSAVGAAVQSFADAESTRCALEATTETTRGVLTATLALGVWGAKRLTRLVRCGAEERARASSMVEEMAEREARREEMMRARDLPTRPKREVEHAQEQEPYQPGSKSKAKGGDLERRETEQNAAQESTLKDESASQVGGAVVAMSRAEEEKQRRIEEAYAASLRRVEEEVAASVGCRSGGVEEEDDDTIPNSGVTDTRRLSKTAFFFADKK